MDWLLLYCTFWERPSEFSNASEMSCHVGQFGEQQRGWFPECRRARRRSSDYEEKFEGSKVREFEARPRSGRRTFRTLHRGGSDESATSYGICTRTIYLPVPVPGAGHPSTGFGFRKPRPVQCFRASAEDGRPEAQPARPRPLHQPRNPHAHGYAGAARGAGVAELRIAGTRAPEPGRHAPPHFQILARLSPQDRKSTFDVSMNVVGISISGRFSSAICHPHTFSF